jgi:60 kDa SS-A/Ro ribonucleoprotein
MTAMIRNLGKMTSLGLLTRDSQEAADVCKKLQDPKLLKNARIHPFNVLVALKTYARGRRNRRSLRWNPNEEILKALDDAFYCSFKV